MKKYLRYIILVVLLAICAFSLYKYFEPDIEIKKAEKDYEDIIQQVIQEDKDHETLDIDFDKLAKINEDVIGWIYMPNTQQFSYPIVKSVDNHDYLVTGFNKENSEVGVPFVDMNCATDFSDFNTIIFGHYTVSHYMFGELYDLISASKNENIRTIQIYTPDQKIHVYKVFSAREVNVDNSMMFLVGSFSNEHRQAFINQALNESKYNFNQQVDIQNNVINLVCCTQTVEHTKRFVVSATEVEIIDLANQ